MVLGISFDAEAENAAFEQKFAFGFPLLSDPGRQAGIAYGAADDAKAATARRVGVVIGPDGRVRFWAAKVVPKDFPAQALALV